MEASGHKVFNDSIHGHITLHPLLVRVVDTPQFQRLRNLKQLGISNFVYPSACHSRFEHSLGTCYLAGQMVEKLLARDKDRGRTVDEEKKLSLCVQLAGLCHDLGHGAFSHTWELLTESWDQETEAGTNRVPWKHEHASVKMFDHLVKENKLESAFKKHHLGDKEIEIVKELILGKPNDEINPTLNSCDNFLYEIVSNKVTGIDVDKWDYFLRDGQQLNLRITFDYRRLLEFCTVMPRPDPDLGKDEQKKVTTHIAFRDKEIMNLYDMYRVRSALHQTAYKHRVVLNIELMVIDAFISAANAGYCINNNLSNPLKKVHRSTKSMSELTDHVFYDILYSSTTNLAEARTILQRVTTRNLYKFVEKMSLPLPSENRMVYIKGETIKLKEKLKEISDEFRIGMFQLELDVHNHQVSEAKFYRKVRGSNTIEEQSFENIEATLDSFPFQVNKKSICNLLVFITNEDLKLENDAKIIMNWLKSSKETESVQSK